MEMSIVEITARANFLIYEYIKRHLRHSDLAEKFRTVIQSSHQKDVIIFKGLEDLTVVLTKYYSSLGAAAAGEANGPAAADDAEEAGVDNESKLEKKKKRKQKKRERSAQLEGEQEAVAEAAAEPEPQQQQQAEETPEDGTMEEGRKKKKKKRQLEAVAEPPLLQASSDQQPAQEAADEPAAADEAATAEDEAPKKKRRKHKDAKPDGTNGGCENGQACEEVAAAPDAPEQNDDVSATDANGNVGGGGKKQKRHSEPYRRVREEEVVNKHFHDNSFDAKPGSTTGWGFKANQDLKPTQGRSFRHEKTKKKRGSYKGGAIDTGVSSFKFDSDSD